MYLLTFIGLIIAGVSPYYTRKTAMKEEEEEARERIEKPLSEKQKDSVSTPCGDSTRQRGAKAEQGIKGPDHMDPFLAQRHRNTGIFTFHD